MDVEGILGFLHYSYNVMLVMISKGEIQSCTDPLEQLRTAMYKRYINSIIIILLPLIGLGVQM